MGRSARIAIEVVLTAGAGFLACAVPVHLDPGHRDYGSLLRNTVEGFEMYSLALLAAVGFLAGLFGSASVLLLGVATVAVLPAWSLLDMAVGHDHNLFPVEFAFFGGYALFGVLGAWLGRRARSRRDLRRAA